jgi:hypothetical protein
LPWLLSAPEKGKGRPAGRPFQQFELFFGYPIFA